MWPWLLAPSASCTPEKGAWARSSGDECSFVALQETPFCPSCIAWQPLPIKHQQQQLANGDGLARRRRVRLHPSFSLCSGRFSFSGGRLWRWGSGVRNVEWRHQNTPLRLSSLLLWVLCLPWFPGFAWCFIRGFSPRMLNRCYTVNLWCWLC